MNHSIIELLGKTMTVTLMQPADFKEINQWCIDEGWNIGIYDSEIYYKIDPMHHYIAKTNERVASLSIIKHSPTFFTLGPFIVHKSYRGQGVGEALWNEAMTQIIKEYPDAHIALYAVSEQVERYKKADFIPVLTIQRWHLDSNKSLSTSISHQCTTITNKLIPSVGRYYQNHYVTNRDLLFNELLLKPETNGLVFMDDNVIKGFGFIRPCVRGFRIGALVADTPEIAQILIAGLLVFAQSAPVFIDVPDSNPHTIGCMNAFHAVRAPQEDTIMMIKGTGYSSYLKKWEQHYGLFSLEIG
jgi:GNAT superfamily N-acetyltransferase